MTGHNWLAQFGTFICQGVQFLWGKNALEQLMNFMNPLIAKFLIDRRERLTCRRWRNTCSVGEMLDELQWPTLEARRPGSEDQSSLLFFHKIHCGTMSIDKDKYLTLSQSTRSIRSSHKSQYCRPQTYSVRCPEVFFFPQGLFLIGIVWLHLWLQLGPQRSSGHSFR